MKLSGLSNHLKTCDGQGSKLDKKRISAKWICPKCGNHIHSKRDRHVEICDGKGAGASKRKIGRGQSWNKGLNLPDDQRKKISESLKGRTYTCKNEQERRRKISAYRLF